MVTVNLKTVTAQINVPSGSRVIVIVPEGLYLCHITTFKLTLGERYINLKRTMSRDKTFFLTSKSAVRTTHALYTYRLTRCCSNTLRVSYYICLQNQLTCQHYVSGWNDGVSRVFIACTASSVTSHNERRLTLLLPLYDRFIPVH